MSNQLKILYTAEATARVAVFMAPKRATSRSVVTCWFSRSVVPTAR